MCFNGLMIFWVRRWFYTGTPGFLHHLQLGSHGLASILQKKVAIKEISNFHELVSKTLWKALIYMSTFLVPQVISS